MPIDPEELAIGSSALVLDHQPAGALSAPSPGRAALADDVAGLARAARRLGARPPS